MDYELIFLKHVEDVSSLSFAEFPAIDCRFPFNLESTDDVTEAIEKVRFALQTLVDDNDVDHETLMLTACPFGHLSMPNVMFRIDRQVVSTHVECIESIADRREENRRYTNALVGLTLGTTDANLHQTIARSSITEVVLRSEDDVFSFREAFEWVLCESTSLWFYLQTIAN